MTSVPKLFKVNISVIIPTYNEERFLDKCLQAIENAFCQEDDYEVLVVDNNSIDKTQEIARKHGAKLIRNPDKKPATSRNVGARQARGTLLAFIDADCLIDRNWFRYLKQHFEDLEVVAAGTKVCPKFEGATWVELASFRMNQRRGKELSGQTTHVKWLGTSNLLVRRISFEQIGGFDQALHTGEDFDLGERLSEIGKVLMDKRIQTVHLRESKTLYQLFRRELWRGKDSLRHWRQNGFSILEAPSIALPAAFLSWLILSMVGFFHSWEFGFGFLLLSVTCPLLMVLRARDTNSRPLRFLQAVVVAGTYLLARGIALVTPGTEKAR